MWIVLPTATSPSVGDSSATVKYTINIEFFRVLAFAALVTLFGSGMIISQLFVFKPADANGNPVAPESIALLRMFDSSGGTLDARDTVVFQLFGFNHLCNIVDFNPAKLVAAIMAPFFTLPIVAFCVLSHLRDLQSYRSGQITKSLLTLSRICTPIEILCFSMIHLWFVNSPQGDLGFIGHYIPYMMFQIGVGLVAIHQAQYLIQVKKIPFGVPRWAAIWYARSVVFLTILCQVLTISILAGHPILDSKGDEGQRAIFQRIANVYAFVALVVPIFLASISMKNDDTTTIEFS